MISSFFVVGDSVLHVTGIKIVCWRSTSHADRQRYQLVVAKVRHISAVKKV